MTTPFAPTPMHPSCCAACSKPMLHTCEPHVRLCRACTVALTPKEQSE